MYTSLGRPRAARAPRQSGPHGGRGRRQGSLGRTCERHREQGPRGLRRSVLRMFVRGRSSDRPRQRWPSGRPRVSVRVPARQGRAMQPLPMHGASRPIGSTTSAYEPSAARARPRIRSSAWQQLPVCASGSFKRLPGGLAIDPYLLTWSRGGALYERNVDSLIRERGEQTLPSAYANASLTPTMGHSSQPDRDLNGGANAHRRMPRIRLRGTLHYALPQQRLAGSASRSARFNSHCVTATPHLQPRSA